MSLCIDDSAVDGILTGKNNLSDTQQNLQNQEFQVLSGLNQLDPKHEIIENQNLDDSKSFDKNDNLTKSNDNEPINLQDVSFRSNKDLFTMLSKYDNSYAGHNTNLNVCNKDS